MVPNMVQILEAKDRLILDLTGELKLKDDEYVRGLKQQAEDVDELLTAMAHEIETVQEAYARELNEVEAAFLKVCDIIPAHIVCPKDNEM
jgi:dynein regulatory complex protein 1